MELSLRHQNVCNVKRPLGLKALIKTLYYIMISASKYNPWPSVCNTTYIIGIVFELRYLANDSTNDIISQGYVIYGKVL